MEETKENSKMDESCTSELNELMSAASPPSSVWSILPSMVQPLCNLSQSPPPRWEKPDSLALSPPSLSLEHISSPLQGSQPEDIENPDSVNAHSPSLPMPSTTSDVQFLSKDSCKAEKPESPSVLPYSPSFTVSSTSMPCPSSPLQESPTVVPPIPMTAPSITTSQSTSLSQESPLYECENKNLVSCSPLLPAPPAEPLSSLQMELSFPEEESPPVAWENQKVSSTSSLDSSLLPAVPPPPSHVSSPSKGSPPPGLENPKSPSILLDSDDMPLHGLPSSCTPLDDSAPPGWENTKPEDLTPSPSVSVPQPPMPNPQPQVYPVIEMGQLVCGSCHDLLSYPRSSTLVQCPCCQTVNYVLEEHQVGNVQCGKCSVLLMYPDGSPSVRCSRCLFVTKIGLHNKRPPQSVLQGRNLKSQNCG